jgi:hypothetical protein
VRVRVRVGERRVEAEEVAGGERGEDGGDGGGEPAADEAPGDLLAEAGEDVADLVPLQRLRAVQRDQARLRRCHRRRERHVRAPLHGARHQAHTVSLTCISDHNAIRLTR